MEIYLDSKTAMPASKLIEKLGNCWSRFIMDWLPSDHLEK